MQTAVNTFYMVSSVLLCKMDVCLPAGTGESCPWFSHNSRLPRALVQTLAVNKAAPGELDAPQVCRGRKHTKRPCPLAQSVTVAICPHCIIMGITSQSQALIHKHRFRFPQTGPFFTSPGREHFPAVNTECKHIPQVENILWKYLYQPLLVDIDMDLSSALLQPVFTRGWCTVFLKCP